MSLGDLASTIISIISTVIGGFIAGVSGVLVAYYSEKRRRAMEHFRDIKHLCLEPELKELKGLRERLMIRRRISHELDLEPREANEK
jgi:hypothetical protein